MSADSRAVANLLLAVAANDSRSLTNLEIQKHIFFCHVWSLIELKRPLVSDIFEAWRYGPVIPPLYDEFSVFKSDPITALATKLDPKTGSRIVVPMHEETDDVGLVNRAYKFYSKLSATGLVELAHEPGGPWHKAWFHSGSVNPGMKISNCEIAKYYASWGRWKFN